MNEVNPEAKVKMTVRLPAELQLRLKLVAVRERKSVEEIVNGLVEAYCRKKEAEGE